MPERVNILAYETIEARAKVSGNSTHIITPMRWRGKKVIVAVLEPVETHDGRRRHLPRKAAAKKAA